MQILLTGAFGNVGMSVLTELLNRGYFVRIFELPTKRNKKIASQFIQTHNVEIIWGDLRNYLDILKAMENIDYVFHIGAIIPPMADKLPKLAEAVNVGGTHNVLKAIKAQKNPPKILYTSSISVYGDRRDNPWIRTTDSLNPSPNDKYGDQKMRAELMVRNSGLEWCIFRLTYITSMNKLDLDPLMFEMPLETCIEICDTKDVGLAVVNTIENDAVWGNIFNIAGGNACRTTFGEYLITMLKLFGLGDDILPADAFSHEKFHCGWLDTQKSQEILHYQRTTLQSYYEEVKYKARFTRIFATLFRPIAKAIILRRSPYFKAIRRSKKSHRRKLQTIGEYLKNINRITSQIMKTEPKITNLSKKSQIVQ
ncbi:MAG: NAD(P)-dependent oxidoreductase [Candidatus Lokiarchaeota archaeon]|nr:NAD(P)-dependent oxidoreductase [Candidatus Harpocratesius repetitus]